jgi:predicted small lipoprotein YifL
MRALMAVTACALFLSACGVKGPLYLPPTDPVPANASPAGETPVDSPVVDKPE